MSDNARKVLIVLDKVAAGHDLVFDQSLAIGKRHTGGPRICKMELQRPTGTVGLKGAITVSA